jgi:hypothetical protein
MLLMVAAGIVGVTFYLAGPALGVALAGIAAVLLFQHVYCARASGDDLMFSITNNPAFSDWEGNIFHRKSPPGGFTD